MISCFENKSKPIRDKMDLFSPNRLSYSCFLGLEDHTRLHVATDWTIDGDYKRIKNKEIISIKAGDLVMMTSNCLHAGKFALE